MFFDNIHDKKNTYFFKPDRLDKFCDFNFDCGTNSGSFCCKETKNSVQFVLGCTWLIYWVQKNIQVQKYMYKYKYSLGTRMAGTQNLDWDFPKITPLCMPPWDFCQPRPTSNFSCKKSPSPPSWTQWAAVKTVQLLIRVPPQKVFLSCLFRRLACHGNSPSSDLFP